MIVETAGACNMPERIAAADRLVEAQTLPEELRAGSRRTGNALLSVHAKLGTPGAKDYLKRVRDWRGAWPSFGDAGLSVGQPRHCC